MLLRVTRRFMSGCLLIECLIGRKLYDVNLDKKIWSQRLVFILIGVDLCRQLLAGSFRRFLVHQSFSEPSYCKVSYYQYKNSDIEQIQQQTGCIIVRAYGPD